MPKKVSDEQRRQVLDLLSHGQDRDTIAVAVGVTPGQVSAISAHVKMGTYTLPVPSPVEPNHELPNRFARETTPNLLAILRAHTQQQVATPRRHNPLMLPIWIGTDAESGEKVYWNPDPDTGAANC